MKISVLSDGGWGTALALLLNGNGHDVALWGPFPDYVEEMKETRQNRKFLAGVELPLELKLTADLQEAVSGARIIVLAAPSQYMRKLLQNLKDTSFPDDAIFVDVAKGFELDPLLRMSELVESVLGQVRYAVLSGPSHAEEVARKVPTAVVVASRDPEVAECVQVQFMNDTFRVYTSMDVVGLELGGALKNILALAAGICDGMGFGDNTKAALMTRGIVEMARLGEALGGSSETFSGLSGIGDIIVTCMSRHSRNRHVGEELGKGRKLQDIQNEMGGQVAEGVRAAKAAFKLAREKKVETPIFDQMYAVLYENKDPQEAVHALMGREAKPELLK